MLIKNVHTGKLSDVTDIIIRHHGTIDDLVNYPTCRFFMDNTDPKEFTVEYHTQDKVMQRTKKYTKLSSLIGGIADARYKLTKENNYIITKFIVHLKPKSLIKLEKEHLMGMIPYQKPIRYKIIFDNDSTKRHNNE
jgi:hypothetical protein